VVTSPYMQLVTCTYGCTMSSVTAPLTQSSLASHHLYLYFFPLYTHFSACYREVARLAPEPLFKGPANLHETASKYMFTFKDQEEMELSKKMRTTAAGGLASVGVSVRVRESTFGYPRSSQCMCC
jgi:hypothetical protein